MYTKKFHFLGIFASLALILSCFLPWTFYKSVNIGFNGFNVEKFSTGNYYGKAGYAISILSLVAFCLMQVQRIWAKRVNIFLSALIFAYCLRTFIIFTSGLIEGDVEKN